MATINELLKERDGLMKQEETEEIKRKLKNLNERIRVYNKKQIEENKGKNIKNVQEKVIIQKVKKEKVIKEKKVTIKMIIMQSFKDGLKDPEKIADKHKFKINSVLWYINKLKLK